MPKTKTNPEEEALPEDEFEDEAEDELEPSDDELDEDWSDDDDDLDDVDDEDDDDGEGDGGDGDDEDQEALDELEAEELDAAGYEEFAVPPALLGIGVRIEDDIVITDNGYENLTGMLPTDPDDVEALCAEAPTLPFLG